MSWNYRVVRFIDDEGEDFYEIKEVYYDDDGIPELFGDAVVCGSNFEELWNNMAMFEVALKKPLLEHAEFKKYDNDDLRFDGL